MYHEHFGQFLQGHNPTLVAHKELNNIRKST